MAVDLHVNDIVLVTFEGKLDGQQILSGFHYRVSQTDGSFPMFEELDEFIGRIRAPNKLFQLYQNIITDNLVDLQVYAQVIYPIRYRYTNAGEDTQTGAQDSICYPANVQASITRAAERAGRRYVSHLALPSIPIGAVENSLLTAGFLEDMNLLAVEMTKSVVLPTGAVLDPVIFHPKFDPVYSNIMLAFPQPTSRVMRRRTVGLGS